MSLELLPATEFSIQELTDLYNQTRVDYLVPMPMNAQRLAEYIHDFDIDLNHSCVARSLENGAILGIGMLGVRSYAAWVTRLGVLPTTRRSGAGEAIMDSLIHSAETLGLDETHLEVIQENVPAHALFKKKGFVDVGEYLVMRRAPHSIDPPRSEGVTWLDREAALANLWTYPNHLTWITAYASMANARQVEGLQVTLSDGSSGWLVYRNQKFFVSHLVMHTLQGDPTEVGTELLQHLYMRYPRMDSYVENIHVYDPHLFAFTNLSFFENFSRIEMIRKNENAA